MSISLDVIDDFKIINQDNEAQAVNDQGYSKNETIDSQKSLKIHKDRTLSPDCTRYIINFVI